MADMDFPQHVLITGITGCIGSAVARRLTEQGVRTSGLVRAHGAPAFSLARAARQRNLSGATLVPCESASVEELTYILDEVQPHAIIHLAAAGVSPRDREVTNLLKTNVDLTVNLMLAAERSVRPIIVHVGSCFEYADSGSADLSETSPTHPFSLYGASKSASVHLAVGLAIELQLRLVVLRLFGVYGASESPDRFVPAVIRNLAAGQAMALTPGTQQRDLMFVEDMADAFATALNHMELLENLGIYNICTGQATTIRQVGETIAQEMKCPASLLEWGAMPPRVGEPDRIVGDGSRFMEATGWRPKHDLRSGLRQTIQALAPQIPALRRAA